MLTPHSPSDSIEQQEQATESREAAADSAQDHPALAEPLYPIPPRLVDALDRHLPGWLTAEESAAERQFAQLCDSMHGVALFHGRYVGHLLFQRPVMTRISDELLRWLGWDTFTTTAQVELALGRGEELSGPIKDQLEAYLGWLITNPVFLAERDALKSKWQAAVGQMGGIPSFRAQLEMEYRELPPADSGYCREEIVLDFTVFYSRWQLTALPTWDLPQPVGANIGGPAWMGALIGVEDRPVVQLAQTVRLPARYPLRDISRDRPDDHLAEWRAVLAQKHPQHFNFARWRRILQLHFLRNIVLESGYGDRFRRHADDLDWAFAHYFGDKSQEHVRKLRLWLDRRLKPPTTRGTKRQAPNR